MINYECQNCNEPFSAEEPDLDGRELCDPCRAEFKQAATCRVLPSIIVPTRHMGLSNNA